MWCEQSHDRLLSNDVMLTTVWTGRGLTKYCWGRRDFVLDNFVYMFAGVYIIILFSTWNTLKTVNIKIFKKNFFIFSVWPFQTLKWLYWGYSSIKNENVLIKTQENWLRFSARFVHNPFVTNSRNHVWHIFLHAGSVGRSCWVPVWCPQCPEILVRIKRYLIF